MKARDIVIVGAGPAGVIAAEALQPSGLPLCIVEGGATASAQIPETDEDLWAYESNDSRLEWLRVRAVGGASLAWGGWCNRFDDAVFRRGRWPFGSAVLAPFYRRAEERVAAGAWPVGDRFDECAGAVGMTAAAMRMSQFRGSAWTSADTDLRERIRSRTIAMSIEPGPDGSGLLHVYADGELQQIEFRALLLACSPIETARLLLASGLREPAGIGRGLTYHPVAGYALVEPPASGPVDAGAALLVPAAAGRTHGPGFTVELTGPFLYESLSPDVQTRVQSVEGLQPDSRITFIHCLGELWPYRHRFVELSSTKVDSIGRPIPRIRMAWSDDELALMTAMQEAALDVAEALADADACLVEYLDPVNSPMLFHEAGTCASGNSPDAPCDASGRLRSETKVWVVDASVFPTSGDRHPTLTIMAQAWRTAGSVAAELGG